MDGARAGIAAETLLTDRIKSAVKLPISRRVWFNWLDQQFFGNTGVLAAISPATRKGTGVQLEAMLCYYVTPQWSIGVGGRYWAMWTSSGTSLTAHSDAGSRLLSRSSSGAGRATRYFCRNFVQTPLAAGTRGSVSRGRTRTKADGGVIV